MDLLEPLILVEAPEIGEKKHRRREAEKNRVASYAPVVLWDTREYTERGVGSKKKCTPLSLYIILSC